MKTYSLKQALLFGTTSIVSAASLLTGAPAWAQETAASDTIVITGTRIARPGYASTSPIATVDADAIAKKQPVDVETVLRQMPQFAPGNGGQVNNGSSGTSTLDLRGLTTPRTLPLIDGKRMVGFDTYGLFDVTAVPLALLKQVDVVTGGASAVYGSDAVAGVVNFILNDNFQGVQFDGNLVHSDKGVGETDSWALTTGASLDNGRGNVALSIGYLNKKAVYQTIFPGNATPGASTTTDPAAIDSASGGRTQFEAGGALAPYYQGFDFNPQNLYQTPQKRWNAMALARYELGDNVEAYSRFIYNKSTSAPQLASSGTFGFSFEVPLTNPFLSSQAATYLAANNPVAACSEAALGDCVDVGIRWRSVAVGPRQYVFAYDTFQALGGLRGNFGTWKWDIAGAHGETSLKRQQNNDIDSNKFQAALFATSATACSNGDAQCSPVNIFNPSIPLTSAAAQYISLNLQVQSITQQDYVTGTIGGDLPVASPWATSPIGMSFGAEYRQESSSYQPDAASASGVSPGFGQTLPISGNYYVVEQFAEALVPIIEEAPFAKSLTAELGFRHSDYTTSGNTNTYKYGLNYEPVEGLHLRGMFQRAVRAANIFELYSPRTPGTGDLLVDPCSGGVTGTLRTLCLATGVPLAAIATLSQPTSGQINNFLGGSTALKPETADTVTFGFVWRPEFASKLALTVDYYDISIDDAISIRPAYDIVDGCYNLARNTAASATATDCLLISRNATNGTMEGDLIYGVDQTVRNIGTVHAEGIDYSISYPFEFTGGTLEVGLDGTHAIDTSYVPSPGGATVSCVGHYGKQCGLPSTVNGSTSGPTPRDRFVQHTNWTSGPFSGGYFLRYLSGSTVDATQAAATSSPSDKIPEYIYVDLEGAFQITPTVKLRFGATNIFNNQPPQVDTETGSSTSNSGNTYPSTYDVLGRILTVGFSAKF